MPPQTAQSYPQPWFSLKGVTLSLQVSCVPTQNVSIFWVGVSVLEEVVPHEGVVALGVVSGEACGAPRDTFRQEPTREPWATAPPGHAG